MLRHFPQCLAQCQVGHAAEHSPGFWCAGIRTHGYWSALPTWDHLSIAQEGNSLLHMKGKGNVAKQQSCTHCSYLYLPTNSHWLGVSKLWGVVKDREACVLQSMGSQRVRHDWMTEQQGLTICFNFHNLETLLNPSLQWSNIFQESVIGYTTEVTSHSNIKFS